MKIMGILNCSPDSFSDGAVMSVEARAQKGLALLQAGADIIDVGGASSRPGAAALDAASESARVVPVIKALRRETAAPISIDTYSAAVARAALAAGANMLNDITALTGDPAMLELAVASQAPVVLMHMQGTPATMQDAPAYADPVAEVSAYLTARAKAAEAAGVARENIILDPGFGFGKSLAHNRALFQALPALAALGYPLLAGVSRKSMLSQVVGAAGRDSGSLALGVLAQIKGAAYLRVHDVAASASALQAAAYFN